MKQPDPERSAPPQSARFALRAATADAHRRLDNLYSTFDLSRADDYGAFLLSHAPGFVAVERALEAAGAARLFPDWRPRAAALLADIQTMDLTPPPPAPAPSFGNDAQILGGLYVLEGSRLGAAVLIRSVAPGLPAAFLTPGNPADWRAFISIVEGRIGTKDILADAIQAAHAVFAVFEHAVRMHLESASIAP